MKLSKINIGLLAALEGQGSASKGMWGHKSYVMRFSWLTLFLIPLKIRSEGRSASKGKGVRGHKSNVRGPWQTLFFIPWQISVCWPCEGALKGDAGTQVLCHEISGCLCS